MEQDDQSVEPKVQKYEIGSLLRLDVTLKIGSVEMQPWRESLVYT